MRILLLNGSPRSKGNTNAMLEVFTDGAKSAGHTLARFDAANMKVNSCTGCRNCWDTGKPCFLPRDDMAEIYAAFEACDAIVFASPVYWYSYTAQLKAVIDRFEPYTGKLKGRQMMKIRFSALLSCAEARSARVFTGLLFAYHEMVEYLGWIDCGSIVVPNVRDIGDIYRTDTIGRLYEFGSTMGATAN